MAERGFTLLELLVVLAVLAILLRFAPVFGPHGPGGVATRVSAQEIAALLRQARSQAIATNRDVVVAFDVGAGRFGVAGAGESRSLPPDTTMTIVSAAEERLDARTSAIRFFPNGMSTGGTLTLRQGSRGASLSIDWLTGRVSVGE